MKTMQQLASDALMIQDACNGFAIANSYGKAMTDLRETLQSLGESVDTDSLRRHPVNQLWASKIHDLAGLGLSEMDRFAKAYQWCQEQAAKEAA